VVVTEPTTGWHPVASSYAETHWLPTIGPTPWVVARRLCLIGCGAGWGEVVQHSTEVLGRMVGVGVPHLAKAIDRLNRFGLSAWLVIGVVPLLSLRGAWPPLPRRHHDRFSDFLPPET
jgi:hypothetical protein